MMVDGTLNLAIHPDTNAHATVSARDVFDWNCLWPASKSINTGKQVFVAFSGPTRSMCTTSKRESNIGWKALEEEFF